MTPQNRIPELDLARGLCILFMAAVHLVYDLSELYSLIPFPDSPLFLLVKQWGGSVFFLISGISATLGHRPLRRGVTVYLCGVVVSAVTAAAGYLPIRFGVLHCLGVCMILWTWFQKFPVSTLLPLSALFLAGGWVFSRCTVSLPGLHPLGLCTPDFLSADFFPLFPFLGFFLAGGCLGRKLYPERRSLLPRFSFASPVSRFLGLCGRFSLPIYLAHQPVLIFSIETAIFIGGIFHEASNKA